MSYQNYHSSLLRDNPDLNFNANSFCIFCFCLWHFNLLWKTSNTQKEREKCIGPSCSHHSISITNSWPLLFHLSPHPFPPPAPPSVDHLKVNCWQNIISSLKSSVYFSRRQDLFFFFKDSIFRCEGDLAATSVTPLVSRVDPADMAG